MSAYTAERRLVKIAGSLNMQSGDHARAREAITKLMLNGPNSEVAGYWLSKWHSDIPPTLGAFSRRTVWQHTPAIAIFDVQRNNSLRCVTAGSFYKMALGFELAGQDILAITPVEQRAERLAWCWSIVEGAVASSYRSYKSVEQQDLVAQELSLPFANSIQDGNSRHFLLHTNWRPVKSDWIAGNVNGDPQIAATKQLISFRLSSHEAPPHGEADIAFV